METGGDIVLKKWSGDGRPWWLVAGLGLYLVSTVGWVFSLKYELLSKAVVIFTVVNLVAVVVAGVLLFNEQLTGLQKLGIALGGGSGGFIGVVKLLYFSKKLD